MHTVMTGLNFRIEVGPITNADYLVVRWRARGTYCGGLPAAPSAAIGRDVNFTGTDILRVTDGRVAEYWVNSDTLVLMEQLGAAFMSAQHKQSPPPHRSNPAERYLRIRPARSSKWASAAQP